MPIADDGDSIPEIPPQILQAASRGTLVVFIGAGISRFADCPSWRQYAEKKLNFLFDKKAITYEEREYITSLAPKEILSICEVVLKQANVCCEVDHLFPELPGPALEFYCDILDFEAIYLTTNYDHNIEEAFKLRPNSTGQIVVLHSITDDAIAYLKSGTVLHLHGSLQESTQMVETTEDYLSTYFQERKVPALLDKVFRDYTTLFLGYGLEEMEILQFLFGKKPKAPGEPKHFMLWGRHLRSDRLLKIMKEYYGNIGVLVVPYPLWKHGHEHLKTVVKYWSAMIRPVARSTDFMTQRRIVLDAIEPEE